jgi:hypothetical protein
MCNSPLLYAYQLPKKQNDETQQYIPNGYASDHENQSNGHIPNEIQRLSITDSRQCDYTIAVHRKLVRCTNVQMNKSNTFEGYQYSQLSVIHTSKAVDIWCTINNTSYPCNDRRINICVCVVVNSPPCRPTCNN